MVDEDFGLVIPDLVQGFGSLIQGESVGVSNPPAPAWLYVTPACHNRGESWQKEGAVSSRYVISFSSESKQLLAAVRASRRSLSENPFEVSPNDYKALTNSDRSCGSRPWRSFAEAGAEEEERRDPILTERSVRSRCCLGITPAPVALQVNYTLQTKKTWWTTMCVVTIRCVGAAPVSDASR